MKKVFLFLIMIIISGLLISCSNKAESTKIDHNSIISKESDAIIKSLEPNKGIDDFFQIATVIEELPKDSDKQLIKNLEYLITKNHEYNVKKMDFIEEKLKSYKEGKLPVSSIISTEDDKIRQYKYQYWYNMILPIYRDKNSYEYPLKVNIENLGSLAKSDGYVYKIQDEGKSDDSFTWYYKKVTESNSTKAKGEGIHFAFLTDSHGNIREVYLPPISELDISADKLNEYFKKNPDEKSELTLNNMPLLLKSSNIENNKYMKQILTAEELKNVSVFFNNIDSIVLKSSNRLDNGYISLTADVGDKRLLIVAFINSLDISVSNKKQYDSKYVNDIKVLNNEFTPKENIKANTDELKTIDINSFIASKTSLNTNQEINTKDNSNQKITQDQGIEIVRSKVKIETGFHLDFESLRTIKGTEFYLYTLSNNDYTTGAYCVDIKTGQLFKCSDTMILTPIN